MGHRFSQNVLCGWGSLYFWRVISTDAEFWAVFLSSLWVHSSHLFSWHGFWTEILCRVSVCVSVVVCLLVAPLKTSCLVYGWWPGVLWYELKKQSLYHLSFHSVSFALWYPFLLKNSSNHFITYLPSISTLLDPGIKDTHIQKRQVDFLWYLVSKK